MKRFIDTSVGVYFLAHHMDRKCVVVTALCNQTEAFASDLTREVTSSFSDALIVFLTYTVTKSHLLVETRSSANAEEPCEHAVS